MLLDSSPAARVAAFLSCLLTVKDPTFAGLFASADGTPTTFPCNGNMDILLAGKFDPTFFDDVIGSVAGKSNQDAQNWLRNRWDSDNLQSHIAPWRAPSCTRESLTEKVAKLARSIPQHPKTLTPATLKDGQTIASLWSLVGRIGRDNLFPADGYSVSEFLQFLGNISWVYYSAGDHETMSKLPFSTNPPPSEPQALLLGHLKFLWDKLNLPLQRRNWDLTVSTRRANTFHATQLIVDLFSIFFNLFNEARQTVNSSAPACQRAIQMDINGQPSLRSGPVAVLAGQATLPSVAASNNNSRSILDQLAAWRQIVTSKAFPEVRYGPLDTLPQPDPACFDGESPIEPPMGPPALPPPQYHAYHHPHQHQQPYHNYHQQHQQQPYRQQQPYQQHHRQQQQQQRQQQQQQQQQPYQPPQQHPPNANNFVKAGKPCLLFLGHPLTQSEINKRLKDFSRANLVPTIMDRGRAEQICFKFTVHGTRGCSGEKSGAACKRLHLDALDSRRFTKEQMVPLHQWFQHPDVSRHFQPTPDFLQCWPVS
jgi:hypothetical protein